MASIKQAVAALNKQVTRIAKSSGAPQVLATQEITAAYRAGTISKAQRDVLQRAISDGSNNVPTIRRTLARYVQAFERGDTNKNTRSDKSERTQHQAALDTWMRAAASTNVPQEQKDALRASVLQTDAVSQSGKKVQAVVFAVGTLLEKLDKLLPESTLAERYATVTNDAIKAGVANGTISQADARAIVGSYHWTQHGEFTDLLADRQLKFAPGARKIITDYLSGPLPESVALPG